MASDVAVPWDIAYFIEHLNAGLGVQNRAERDSLPKAARRGAVATASNAKFLTAVVAAMNDRAKLPDLEHFPEWKSQRPVPLDTPWRSD